MQVSLGAGPDQKEDCSHCDYNKENIWKNVFARTEGKTTSEVVRELLEEYISSRNIAAYVDGLWERIGAQLETRGITADRIPETIQEVRRSKA
jgi:hypothetical protein